MRSPAILLLTVLFAFPLLSGCDGDTDEDVTDDEVNVEIDVGEPAEDIGSDEPDDPVDREEGDQQQTGVLGRPPTEGSWFYRETPTGAVVMFGEPETEPKFAVRCEDRTLHFDRAGAIEPGERVEMTIYTSEGNTRIEASSAGTEIPLLRASLPAGDSWTQRLADAEGKIAVAVDGGEALVMPYAEELSRLIHECSRLRAGVDEPSG